MNLNINNAASRAALVRYIEQLKAFDPNSGSMVEDEDMTRVHTEVIEHLNREVLSYDRSLRPNCYYEPIAGFASVAYTDEPCVVSMESSDDSPIQFCLVWPNTFEPVPPYAGPWDGVVEDYHQDYPIPWSNVRDYPTFGFEEKGSKDQSRYRFLKTVLHVILRDTDGAERLPDGGDVLFAAKTHDELATWIATWDAEEYGPFNGNTFECVPVRLVIPKQIGAPPYVGSWENAPWEDA